MRVNVIENDYVYSIELVAETLQDAAWMARWNLNAKKEPDYRSVYVRSDGVFSGSVAWKVRADWVAEIKRGII